MRRTLITGVVLVLVATPAAAEDALLRILSEPAGASVKFGSVDSVAVTPSDTIVAAGPYHVESSLLGYQPLAHQFTVSPGDTITLRFILLAQRPVRPRPEDLGLSYEVELPLLMEAQADAVRRRFNAMAEVFAIVPLMQGVMAAVALGGGDDYFSGGLMIAGAVLSGGSYLLGKVMADRKLESIREQNEVLAARNRLAEEHNKEIDLQIRQVYADNVRQWEVEAKSRGVVETTRLPR